MKNDRICRRLTSCSVRFVRMHQPVADRGKGQGKWGRRLQRAKQDLWRKVLGSRARPRLAHGGRRLLSGLNHRDGTLTDSRFRFRLLPMVGVNLWMRFRVNMPVLPAVTPPNYLAAGRRIVIIGTIGISDLALYRGPPTRATAADAGILSAPIFLLLSCPQSFSSFTSQPAGALLGSGGWNRLASDPVSADFFAVFLSNG